MKTDDFIFYIKQCNKIWQRISRTITERED